MIICDEIGLMLSVFYTGIDTENNKKEYFDETLSQGWIPIFRLDRDAKGEWTYNNKYKPEWALSEHLEKKDLLLLRNIIDNTINKINRNELLDKDYNEIFNGYVEYSREEKRRKSEENEKKYVIKNNNGYIYIIKERYYKIGRTKRFPERPFQVQTELPHKSEIIYYCEVNNYNDVEKQLHKRFKTKKMNGEWFNLDEKDIENLKMFCEEKKVK